MPVPHRDLGPILQKHGFGEIKKIGEGRLPLSVALSRFQNSRLITDFD
jgi:hypothetical protein